MILKLLEYKDSVKTFWNLEVLINYKKKQIKAFSYLDSISYLIKHLMMMWFDVIYANFISSHKLSDQEVSAIIQESLYEVQNLKDKIRQNLKEQRDHEIRIYKDEGLQKTIKLVLVAIEEIDNVLNALSNGVSQDKVRDIKIMSQELIKLKMWRNIDKMLKVLEDVYHHIYEMKQEYLSKQLPSFPIKGSLVTDLDMMLEINKLKKAQEIKQIWAKRDSDDNYYLSFEQKGVYIKFLIKDIKNKIQNIQSLFFKLFDYFEIFVLFTIVSTSIFLWIDKISYSLSANISLYAFIIKAWTFGICFYIIKMFRKQKLKTDILLFIIAILSSFLVFQLLKYNLSF